MLSTYGIKLSILKNKKNLEYTGVYIKEDFPPQVLEARRLLQDQVKKERDEGRIAYINYDKIVIKDPNQTKRDFNSKKRGLEVTPPHDSINLSRENNPDAAAKYQKAKKNKPVKESQSSMKNYIQKSQEPTMPARATLSNITTGNPNQ